MMNVRTPVIVPRGTLCESKIGGSTLLMSPELLVLDLDRHERIVKTERRRRLLLVYHISIGFAICGPFSWARNTKNVRKAVAAVMISAIFAAMNCQYVSQAESIDLTVRPVWIPEIRVMVHMIVRIVRLSEDNKAIFWLHRILILQISRNGMYRTRSRI